MCCEQKSSFTLIIVTQRHRTRIYHTVCGRCTVQ